MSRSRGAKGPIARKNRHAGDSDGDLPHWSEADFYEKLAHEKDPLLLILDEVTDPHNLGACLRSANAAGALAILTPKHHSASVTDTVIRVSCGAAEHTPVISVSNLARCMERLKEEGVWIVGTDDRATRSIFQTDLKGPLALAMGAEGKGLRRLTRESCDFLTSIPLQGKVPCLNVSVATGICLFEALRQRQALSS
ncbi:MAG: 23S rRNA (guanosine(2251)-2'-O)-methyltransferase RlmB [Verrucomicrobiota bacterium]